MREGLLWFDNDPKRDLAAKVGRAVKHYRHKFGRVPNMCYVHPSMVNDGPVEVESVRVTGLPSVLRHHFWIGEEQRVKV
jgi:hypothetical protein